MADDTRRGCAGCSSGWHGSRTLFIRSRDDLTAVRRSTEIDDIVLCEQLGLSESERTSSAERLVRFRTDCGCTAGGYVMTAAVFALAALFGAGRLTMSIQSVLVAIGVIMIAALAGKIAGLTVARLRLNREIDTIGKLLDRQTVERPLSSPPSSAPGSG